jgi:3-dehydroquinate synthase
LGSNKVKRTTNEIPVSSAKYSYRVFAEAGLLDTIGSTIANILHGSRCAIITDSNVAPLFADRAKQSLTAAGFDPIVITIPAGEQSKTLEQAGAVCHEMIAAGLDRQSFVVGLGGGVVGDLSGFVAAIFQRGIPHVQIPTTLLAMVDSSIGGKTGVNTRDGKNLLGAVHHPSLVIDDVDLLKSLLRRELNQGFAEIIKHAIIADAEMFQQLEQLPGLQLDGLKPSSLSAKLVSLVRRNIEIKARIVATDEFDRTGKRAVLNFGHTVGHAIERAGNYREHLHGEAISLGIVAACAVSMKKAGLRKDQRDAIADLLKKFELPTQLPAKFPREKILSALVHDKKFEGGKVRFVVTPTIGSARLSSDVTMEDIRDAVNEL